MSEKKRHLGVNIALLSLVLGILSVAAWDYFSQCNDSGCPGISGYVEGFGAWAPVAYGVLYVISSPVPFLAPTLSMAAGALFGILWGTIYTLIVAPLSALVPFALARRLGREWVQVQLKGKKLGEIYEESEGDKGFLFILLMRLIPILPWEIQNYIGGLTKVSIPTFLGATLIGIIPGSFQLVFLGAAVAELDPYSWRLYAAIALDTLAFIVPIVVVYIRRRKKKKAE